MEQINSGIKRLKFIYLCLFSILLLFAALVEFVFLDEVGPVRDDNVMEFYIQSLMVMLSLFGCYASLRFFKFNIVAEKVNAQPERYFNLAIVPMVLIAGIMLLNIIFYWFFVNSSFAYLTVMLGIAVVFIYPTKDHYLSVTDKDTK